MWGGAEIIIIHEFLHSLGLGENPPSSAEITKQVQTRCAGESPPPASNKLPAQSQPKPLLPVRSQADAGREISDGPPSNIDAGGFQSVLKDMWRDSPTFRSQCIQLGTASRLKVRIRTELAGPSPHPRARTEISRVRGVVTFADVVLRAARDHIELIAHEFEHIIEELEGHSRRRDVCSAGADAHSETETCRAIDAGRRVAQEVQNARSSADTAVGSGTSAAVVWPEVTRWRCLALLALEGNGGFDWANRSSILVRANRRGGSTHSPDINRRAVLDTHSPRLRGG